MALPKIRRGAHAIHVTITWRLSTLLSVIVCPSIGMGNVRHQSVSTWYGMALTVKIRSPAHFTFARLLFRYRKDTTLP